MKTLDQLDASTIRAVFTDLDDTLTTDSKIPATTYQSLWAIKNAGLSLAIISGRPAGWADCLMRLWPIDFMVFENGAGIMVREGKRISAITLAATSNLTAQREALQKHFDALKKEIPKLRLSSDQPYRLFDFAIDFAEEPPGLSESEVQMVLKYLNGQKEITAKLSSIHINYWCGRHTKETACEDLLKRMNLKSQEVVFVGDSPNDEPLFSAFANSIGVTNLKKYLPALKSPPKFLTKSPASHGFEEVVSHLLTRR